MPKWLQSALGWLPSISQSWHGDQEAESAFALGLKENSNIALTISSLEQSWKGMRTKVGFLVLAQILSLLNSAAIIEH